MLLLPTPHHTSEQLPNLLRLGCLRRRRRGGRAPRHAHAHHRPAPIHLPRRRRHPPPPARPLQRPLEPDPLVLAEVDQLAGIGIGQQTTAKTSNIVRLQHEAEARCWSRLLLRYFLPANIRRYVEPWTARRSVHFSQRLHRRCAVHFDCISCKWFRRKLVTAKR